LNHKPNIIIFMYGHNKFQTNLMNFLIPCCAFTRFCVMRQKFEIFSRNCKELVEVLF
jgi:hypothetical protein